MRRAGKSTGRQPCVRKNVPPMGRVDLHARAVVKLPATRRKQRMAAGSDDSTLFTAADVTDASSLQFGRSRLSRADSTGNEAEAAAGTGGGQGRERRTRWQVRASAHTANLARAEQRLSSQWHGGASAHAQPHCAPHCTTTPTGQAGRSPRRDATYPATRARRWAECAVRCAVPTNKRTSEQTNERTNERTNRFFDFSISRSADAAAAQRTPDSHHRGHCRVHDMRTVVRMCARGEPPQRRCRRLVGVVVASMIEHQHTAA